MASCSLRWRERTEGDQWLATTECVTLSWSLVPSGLDALGQASSRVWRQGQKVGCCLGCWKKQESTARVGQCEEGASQSQRR